ncbi:hypothetical protein E4U55_004765 [Claviceps digitariae]|nr:hypothetical protein E4U55_004765 [Claviceps digitariae]
MAESALAAVTAATPEPDIKQEDEAPELGPLNFNFSPELTSAKRPFEDIAATSETSQPKRAKGEVETAEASFEDDLALLVQNALSNVGDMVDRFTSGSDVLDTPASDPMEVDTTMPLHLEIPAPRPKFAAEPLKYVRDANVHALGNLALSILLILVQPRFEDTIKLVRGTDSEHKRSFHQLKMSFQHVHQLYSAEPVLAADQLEFKDADAKTFIELANLAQLGLWLVDGSPKALSCADDNFLALFQCQLSDLPPGMTELYLSIKTQRAIEFLVEKEPEKPSEQVIGEVLTQGLEDVLKEQHGGGELTSADQSFVSSVQTRKETLEGEVKEQAEPAALREKHPAEDLLRSYLNYAKSKLKTLTDLGDKLGLPIELEDGEPEPELEPEPESGHEHEHDSAGFEATGDADLDLDDLSSFFEKTASGLVQNALAGLTDEPVVAGEASTTALAAPAGGETPAEAANTGSKSESATTTAQTNGGKIDLMTDYKELEALVAESTSNYVKTTLHGLSPVPYQPTVPTSTTESMASSHLPYLAQLQHHQAQNPYYTYTHPPPLPPPPTEPQQSPAPGETLPPNQTFSSAILYDKARQAALSKTSAHTRREGLHSTRRPWTQEEEKALMAGLDMVKGPHWSQILTLFGQNGTISDILRDRTQVQLKDKARNLKLFFLKTNSEMPYYLQAVTGELKTRAPTQAARKEAEERARLNSEEDQAKLQGIMALAGGLQHPPQRTSTSSAAAAASSAGSGGTTVASAQQKQQLKQQGHEASSPAQQDAATGNHQNKATSQNGYHHNQHHPHASIPRPTATPASQIRPGVQTNTQQLLHAVAQAHQRPHAQLPPQVPRPQGQQQKPQQPQQPQQQSPQAQPLHQTLMQQPSPRTSATPQPPHANTNGSSPALPAQSPPSRSPATQQQQQKSSTPTTTTMTTAATAATAAVKAQAPSVTVPVSSSSSSLALPPQAQQQPPGPAVSAAPRPAPQPASSTASPVIPQQHQTQPQPQQHSQPQSQPQPQPQPPLQAQPQPQQQPAPIALPQEAIKTEPEIKTEFPSQQEQDDNAAEAALLEGLQAVVAQTLAS